eukprot:g4768.t1
MDDVAPSAGFPHAAFAFCKGDTVRVAARTWPGINKPGGTARISKCNDDGTFDVSYILGGRERGVERKYIEGAVDLVTERTEKKRRAAPAPGSFASKRPKVSPPKLSDDRGGDDGSDGSSVDGGNGSVSRSNGKSRQTRSASHDHRDVDGNSKAMSSSMKIEADMKYAIGDVVTVLGRTWPGINRPGGTGRITKVNLTDQTVDVKFLLGGYEKDVLLEYVSFANNIEESSKRTRKPSARARDSMGTNDGVKEHSKTTKKTEGTSAEVKIKNEDIEPRNAVETLADAPPVRRSSPRRIKRGRKLSSSSPPPSSQPSSSSSSARRTVSQKRRVGKLSPGFIMYKPDLFRFQIVKDTVEEFRESEAVTLSLADLLSAANETLSERSSSSSSRKSSDKSSASSHGAPSSISDAAARSVDMKPFDTSEMVGHLTALETDRGIMFVKQKGMLYFVRRRQDSI